MKNDENTPNRVMPRSPGRPKGSLNRTTKAIKDMIIEALDEAGGVEYLTVQAKKNPKAFLGLLARIIPLQVTGNDGGPIKAEMNVTLTAEEAYKQMLGNANP